MLPSRHSRFAHLALLAPLVVGCATASQRAYIAPSDETITTSTEERTDNPPQHTIYVINQSTVPITVFSVSLVGCQNVKQHCEPTPVNIKVPAGTRSLI